MHVSVVSMSFLIRTGIRKLTLILVFYVITPVRRGKRERSIRNYLSSKFKDQPGSCPAEKTWRRQRGRDLAEKAMDAPAKTKVSCFLILSIHNYQLHMNQQESCTVAYLRAARTYAFMHGLIRRLLAHGSVLASSQS